jgi:hypothetical protein
VAESFDPNEIKRITLSATPGNATRADFDYRSKSCLIQFFEADGTTPAAGKVSFDDVDAAPIGADFATVPANAEWPITLRTPEGTAIEFVSLASTIASAIVEVVAFSPEQQ